MNNSFQKNATNKILILFINNVNYIPGRVRLCGYVCEECVQHSHCVLHISIHFRRHSCSTVQG